MVDGENAPVGSILCAGEDSAVAHDALEGLPNKVLAAEYRTVLPKEPVLVAEIEKTIHAIETRRAAKPKPAEAKVRRRKKCSTGSDMDRLKAMGRPRVFTEAEYRADATRVVAHAVATGRAIVARADGTTRVVISIPPADPSVAKR